MSYVRSLYHSLNNQLIPVRSAWDLLVDTLDSLAPFPKEGTEGVSYLDTIRSHIEQLSGLIETLHGEMPDDLTCLEALEATHESLCQHLSRFHSFLPVPDTLEDLDGFTRALANQGEMLASLRDVILLRRDVLVPAPAITDITELARDVVAIVAQRIAGRIHIHLHGPDAAPIYRGWCDAAITRRMLRELLMQAASSSAHGQDGRVTISLASDADYVTCNITASGRLLPPDDFSAWKHFVARLAHGDPSACRIDHASMSPWNAARIVRFWGGIVQIVSISEHQHRLLIHTPREAPD